jgi:hypothetical protein
MSFGADLRWNRRAAIVPFVSAAPSAAAAREPMSAFGGQQSFLCLGAVFMTGPRQPSSWKFTGAMEPSPRLAV